MIIRRYLASDAEAARRVAQAAICATGAEAYTPDQVAAWNTWTRDAQAFAALLAEGETWVAEADGVAWAFGQRLPHDHINLLYTHPDVNRQGMAGRIYVHMEAEARREGVGRLTAHASHLARPFFETHGWRVTARETIQRHGVAIERFAMEKTMVASGPGKENPVTT